MKKHLYLGVFVCICLTFFSCEGDAVVAPPAPPSNPTRVFFAQQNLKDAYELEIIVPWTVFDLMPQENLEIGFDAFLTDDDDGGLLDQKLAWHAEGGSSVVPVPARFGKLSLKNEVDGTVSGEVQFIETEIQIDGKAEDVWQESPAYPISNVLKGEAVTPADFSGEFRVLWDTTALYLFFSLRDERLSVDSWGLPWEDDGVALYFDPFLKRGNELKAGETFLFRMHRDSRQLMKDEFPVNPEWTVPVAEVFDGGPGKDGIPALLSPSTVSADMASFLEDEDLVIGYVNGTEARAYPHRVLDWHEIINDEVNGTELAITYCPLTGTGIAWDRNINGRSTTFGVSGLLYNTNLIPYDRETDSNWSQIRMDCIEGENLGQRAQTLPIVETTWKTWKSMFPQTQVVSLETGFSRDYSRYPYGDYRTNDEALIFPIANDDDRLPRKERVHAIIANKHAQVYELAKFSGNSVSLVHDSFRGVPVIVAGNAEKNFAVSYGRELEDGTRLLFSPEESPQDPSIIMKDQEGNQWNVMGLAVSGPRTGTQLPKLDSYMGYWFSFGAFFPELEIR